MLRGPGQFFKRTRSIYISSRNIKPSPTSRYAKRSAENEELAAKQEAALLDKQLKELKLKHQELQTRLRVARDKELQQKLVQLDNLRINGQASAQEIALIEKELKAPPAIAQSEKRLGRALSKRDETGQLLPQSILDLLPQQPRMEELAESAVASESSQNRFLNLVSKPKVPDWQTVVAHVDVLPPTIPTPDVEKFVSCIPLKGRAAIAPQLEHMIPVNCQSQFVKDQIMAGYAERGEVPNVQRLLQTCSQPTLYSYGHWAKSLFKSGSQPEQIFAVIKEMQEKGITASLPVMSNAIQSLIRHGRYGEAEKMFDNMKYWSVETQPDRKLYNSMIICAAKQHNVNRCLDLLTELKERRPFPLQPDAETFNYVIYACARDPKTHLTAWELFLEARDLGFQANLQSFRALLYLCGSSGEVMLARVLIRNLSLTSPQFIDDFALNCLFSSYRHWQPGPSKILTSPSGQSIRANIMMNNGSLNGDSLQQSPIPFLSVPQLDRKTVLLESSAVFEYYADTQPQSLRVQNRASASTSPVLHNFLQTAINFGEHITEFKRRFTRFTEFAEEESTERTKLLAPEREDGLTEPDTIIDKASLAGTRHPNFAEKRDQHLYNLAIEAAVKFRDLEFGRLIWTERGKWRKTSQFRGLPQQTRNGQDFQFARKLVELLAVCGNIEEALLLVKSAQKLRKWKKHHLTGLLAACEELEDVRTIKQINAILKSNKLPEA